MRLFFALWPPPPVVTQLAALPQPSLPGVRWTSAEQWHITLHFLGEQSPDAVPVLAAVLGQVVRRSGPVEVTLGPATARLGSSVLCLPAAGLDELAGVLGEGLAGRFTGPSTRPSAREGRFRGHLTLARARRGARIPASLVGTAFEARWPVGEVCLVSSTTAPQGARYETVLRERL